MNDDEFDLSSYESFLDSLSLMEKIDAINNIKKMNFEILDRITSNKIDFLRNEKKHIFLFETSSIDISSSQIRSKISQNENLSGLLPGSILSYIKRNKLYTDLY